jgi:hypothetical protein
LRGTPSVAQHGVDRLGDDRAVAHAKLGVFLEKSLELNIGRRSKWQYDCQRFDQRIELGGSK